MKFRLFGQMERFSGQMKRLVGRMERLTGDKEALLLSLLFFNSRAATASCITGDGAQRNHRTIQPKSRSDEIINHERNEQTRKREEKNIRLVPKLKKECYGVFVLSADYTRLYIDSFFIEICKICMIC
ncbi:MAG: hypothetical protein LBQ50_09415 [Planctomycetaceae bacterium]|jgi:hypothetical protein|nr:hypothetical protein [Planctomycetaceae bacterium]